MSNQQAFLRFKEFLESRQLVQADDRDIREHVLSLTGQKVGIGLMSEVLKTRFGANLPNLFSDLNPVDQPGIAACSTCFMHGTVQHDPAHSHNGAVTLLSSASEGTEFLLMETGFLATSHSWIHSAKEKNPAYACLGYVYDDIAHYFMTDNPNRIIRKLNSVESPTAQEMDRAEGLVQRIVAQRISKYNAQPMTAPTMTEGYTRRILVCDQAYADASTIYGKVGDDEFERMLLAAINENPDAEILVKTHPDSVWEKNKRSGYYAHLQSTGRVRMLRDPVNPYVLFDLVDTVYVGTSQMGLEALFAGKKVVTFGAPFYAGWGLTDDRQKIPHRHRTRSLAEVFHYFYIWYTIYHLPEKKGPAEIEDVLDYIERHRPYHLPLAKEPEAAPKVSIIIPVYGVEKYIEECIVSVQRQTLRDIEIIPINDASPDGSQSIIDRLAAEDSRIKPIILSENIGQGFARNRGLQAARGEYIWFIDSDDWLVDPEFLENTVQVADHNNADMTRAKKAGEAVFNKADTLLKVREDVTEKYFTTDVDVTNYRENPDILHSRHFCLWLYRRSFICKNDIKFVTTQWEERGFLLKALLRAEIISLTTNNCFMYRIRQDSTARRSKTLHDVERLLQNFEQISALLQEHGAADRQNLLRTHLDFQLSHFLHILFYGFWYRSLISKGNETAPYLERVAQALESVDFRDTDLTDDPEVIRKDLFHGGVYHLIVAALRARRFDWIETAVSQSKVQQAQLYEALLAEPADESMAAFQAVLSSFARNEQVQRAVAPTHATTAAKPRVVIHIGATKTGSTFIQHMLDKNRPALLRQGVWVPEVGLFWQPTRPHKQAGHAGFSRAAIRNEPELREHIRRGLELMGNRIHTIVLSSEAFFLQENAHLLADYFADHPVEMVVYLRRQDEWANSQYCEFVAGGAVGRVDIPVEDWLRQRNVKNYLNYPNVLGKWREKIGLANVHVRIFDRTKFHGGDLLTDFAKTIGLPQLLDLPRPETSEQNDARLSAAHVAVLRMFNKKPFDSRDSYFNFIEEVGTAITSWRLKQGLSTPKPWVLSVPLADALMEEYAEANIKVARDYLNPSAVALFGPRGTIPEAASIYPEEIAMIESIYQRHSPQEKKNKPAPSKKPVRQPTYQVVNYGMFGWRLWSSVPLLASMYRRRGRSDLAQELLENPAAFAQVHWAGRHPKLYWLAYSDGETMGPGRILRIWMPILTPLIRNLRDERVAKRFANNPVLFVRNLRSPVGRLVGRLLFPMGESAEKGAAKRCQIRD